MPLGKLASQRTVPVADETLGAFDDRLPAGAASGRCPIPARADRQIFSSSSGAGGWARPGCVGASMMRPGWPG